MADITFIICWVHRRSILPTERQLMIAICRLVSFQNTVSVKIMNCTKGGQLLHVTQRSSDTQAASQSVPMKIFYEDSELQVYNTSYIMQVYSDDDGETWHTDKIISGMVKREESRYYLTGPGHGIQIQNGDHAGRLVVPIYYQLTGGNGTLTSGARTEVIYSDDGGNTWAHGDCLPGTVGHESVVVELPNGNLQIFMRNTSGSGVRLKPRQVLMAAKHGLMLHRDLAIIWPVRTASCQHFHIVERLSRKKRWTSISCSFAVNGV